MIKKILSAFLAFSIMASLSVFASARYVGDVDKNGKVNSNDALLILQYSSNAKDYLSKIYADINGDGKINTADALDVLRIIVDQYDGPLVADDYFTTNYKTTKVDPVYDSQKYTLATKMSIDGEMMPITIMIDGKNMAIDVTIKGIDTRMLVKGGKSYVLIMMPVPLTKIKGFYTDIDEVIDVGDVGARSDLNYVHSMYEDIGKTTYVKEMYVTSSGSKYNYYFLNGEWKYLQIVDGEGTTLEEITQFKKGVDATHFSLEGFEYVADLDI